MTDFKKLIGAHMAKTGKRELDIKNELAEKLFGEATNLTRLNIANIISGKTKDPNEEQRVKLCDYFGIDMNQLHEYNPRARRKQ